MKSKIFENENENKKKHSLHLTKDQLVLMEQLASYYDYYASNIKKEDPNFVNIKSQVSDLLDEIC
jgi:hypothetical protein